MRAISVFGLGYVGSVTAACFSSKGHRVFGIDVAKEKVESMATGRTPILEPGIQEIIKDSHAKGMLSATLDVDTAVRESEISFICVGTPSQPNGKLDLKGIKHVCEQIGASLKTKNAFHIVVTRSTILPGITSDVITPALEAASGQKAPGFAFGGSCLPKDLRALAYLGKELDCKLPLIESILPSNQEHIERAAQAILARGKKRIGMLGLSFKSGTDDLRESPQVLLIKKLIGEGCQARIWDENVYLGRLIGSNRQFIEDNIPHIGSLLTNDLEQVVGESDIIVVGTKIDRAQVEALLRPHHIVIDLICLHKQNRVRHDGEYAGICW
jgi:UDP-glucose 6-dehydrogenase